MNGAIVAEGRRLRIAVLVFSIVLSAAGCGSSSSSVSGKVSYKGQPLRGGTISFFGDKDWTASSHLSEEGAYSIANVPPGQVRIAVETKTARPPTPPRGAMPKPPKDAPVPKGSMYDTEGQAKRYVPIPDQYADKDRSGLTYDVKPGKHEHNIELK
jgi:hypothetical protein